MIIVLSDLHLGAGDNLDDFLLINSKYIKPYYKSKENHAEGIQKMNRVFDSFIEHILSLKNNNEKIELLLLGDIFDCLQVREIKYGSPEKIIKIKQAHKSVFNKLNYFTKNGGEITYIVGNHDHELLFPDCFATLKSYIPEINKKYDSKPLHYYENKNLGLYAEHGHQSDFFCRFKKPDDPNEIPFGSILVMNFINSIEEKFPLIDNFKSNHEILWFILKKLPGFLSQKFRKKASLLFNQSYPKMPWSDDENKLFNNLSDYELPDGFINSVLDSSQASNSDVIQLFRLILTAITDKCNLPKTSNMKKLLLILFFSLEKILRLKLSPTAIGTSILLSLSNLDKHPIRLLREAYKEKHLLFAKSILFPNKVTNKSNLASNLIITPPDNLRCLILGHYHTPSVHQWDDKIYANAGTWKAYAVPVKNQGFLISQPLNYLVIDDSSEGNLEVKLCNFRRTKEFKKLINEKNAH